MYVGDEISIVPIKQTYIESFSISHKLPNGLKFDTNTGIITGKIEESVTNEEYL